MSLSITLLAESTGGDTSAASKTTPSFTPPANSKLYLAQVEEGAGAIAAPNNTGGLSFTTKSGPTAGGGAQSDALYEADVGASPSAMTVTANLSVTGLGLAYVCFAVTGNGPRIKQFVRTPTVSTTSVPVGPFPVAATPGNLVVAVKIGNQDTNVPMNFPLMTGVSGFTNLYAPVNRGDGDWEKTSIEYSTSQSTTLSGAAYSHDTGDWAGAYLIEFEEAGIPSVLLSETGVVLLDESDVPMLSE